MWKRLLPVLGLSAVVAFAQAFHSQIQDSRFEDISRQSGLTLLHIPSPDSVTLSSP